MYIPFTVILLLKHNLWIKQNKRTFIITIHDKLEKVNAPSMINQLKIPFFAAFSRQHQEIPSGTASAFVPCAASPNWIPFFGFPVGPCEEAHPSTRLHTNSSFSMPWICQHSDSVYQKCAPVRNIKKEWEIVGLGIYTRIFVMLC